MIDLLSTLVHPLNSRCRRCPQFFDASEKGTLCSLATLRMPISKFQSIWNFDLIMDCFEWEGLPIKGVVLIFTQHLRASSVCSLWCQN